MGSASPVRLAILECDTPLPNTRARYGGYGGVFETLLNAGARELGYSDKDIASQLSITVYQVELHPEKYPKLENIDAILLTGSRHDAFSDTPWINTLVDFTAAALKTDRVRVIGVCFGHQIAARAMDVKVGRNADGWEAAVTEVQLSARGKELFGLDKLHIHQMHRDIAYEYPNGIEALGSSPVCKVQGMYAQNRLITVQGHPEFTAEIMKEIVETRHATGIFDDDAYRTHIKKVPLPHDGVAVSKAFIRFLLEN